MFTKRLSLAAGSCCVLACITLGPEAPAWAPSLQRPASQPPVRVVAPVSEESARQLDAAAGAVQKEAWSDAIRALQSVLDGPGDALIRLEDSKTRESFLVRARSEALRRLEALPVKALAEYRETYGAEAKKLLQTATKDNEVQVLSDVAERYGQTDAGTEALYQLAGKFFERKEYMAASRAFDRLLAQRADQLAALTLYRAAFSFRQVGDLAQARSVEKRLAGKIGKDGLRVDGKLLNADEVQKQLEQIAPVAAGDWPVYRGDAGRSAAGQGGPAFLESAWEHSTLPKEGDPKGVAKLWVEGFVQDGVRFAEQRQQPTLSAFFPVAAGQRLIYCSYDGIYLADLKKEGKLNWWNLADRGASLLAGDPARRLQVDMWGQSYTQFGPHSVLFDNSVVGCLSSDGKRVYAVDDLILPPHPQFLRNFAFGGPPNFGVLNDQVQRNSLKAYHLDSGKLSWSFGSARDQSDLQDSFFLAAPLPLDGRLYVLNEKDRMLRLVCLECKKDDQPGPPEIVWTLPLAKVREGLAMDSFRRLQAAHVAEADGILVCPTNQGTLIGVELATRRIAWAFTYQPPRPLADEAAPVRGIAFQPPVIRDGWKVTAPAVRDGKVVFTAPDSQALHALDLHTGRPLWQVNRGGDGLYFAGIFLDKALIVSRNGVRAVNLADGKEAWRLDGTGLPSGQGAFSDGIYYLPVQAAAETKEPEVCAIDVAKGAVLAHVRGRKRNGKMEVPGNLVFVDGQVVSQTLTRIAGYPLLKVKMREVEERLKQNANDPAGLSDRGALRMDQADLAGAVEDFRAALKNNPAAEVATRARARLFEALTELLRRDFAKGEPYLEEYRALAKVDHDADQRRRLRLYYTLLGRGRASQGKVLEAMQAYVDLAALSSRGEPMPLPDSPPGQIRADVWARGRVAALLAGATPEQRKALDERIAALWKETRGGDDLAAVRRFAGLFGTAAEAGRDAQFVLAERLMKSGQADELREAQLVLLRLRNRRSEPETAARATEALARLMAQKGLLDDAVFYYRELGSDFARVAVRDGKTGSAVWDDIRQDKRFMPHVQDPAPTWRGRFNVSEPQGVNQPQPRLILEPVGEQQPAIRRLHLALETNTQRLRAIDRLSGEDRLPPNTSLGTAAQYVLNQGHQNVRITYQVRGSLAVFDLGYTVYAFDLMDRKKLWEHDLLGAAGKAVAPMTLLRDRDGHLALVFQDGLVQRIGQTGPVELSYVCVQTRTGLLALDPLDGTVLWTRPEVTPRTRLFGDDEHIFLVETDADGKAVATGRALRAMDGSAFQVADFTQAYNRRLKVLGRTLLVKDDTDNGFTLRHHDVLTGKDLWTKVFPAGSILLKADDHDLAGAIRPDGGLTVFDLRAGKEVLSASLDWKDVLKARDLDISRVLDRVSDAHLLSDRDHFYVALHKPLDPEGNVTGFWPNTYLIPSLPVNGMVYAFDRAGKPRWAEEVKSQMLVLGEFKDLPMLLFTARWNKRAGNGLSPVMAIRSIHKQSGKLLYDKELPNGNQFHSVHIDAKNVTIELVTWNYRIRFTLEAAAKDKQ